MAELRGSLEGIGFPALVGFLASLEKSGCLQLTSSQGGGTVSFTAGRVVAAAYGAERGLPALEALALALPRASFVFVDGALPPGDEPTIDLAPGALQRQ